MAIDRTGIRTAAFLHNARRKQAAKTVLNRVLKDAEPDERSTARRLYAAERAALEADTN